MAFRGGSFVLPVLLLLVLLAGTVAAAAEEEGEGPKPKPFWPLTPREWAGIVLSALGLVVAGGSGIGAGGMILPMFILLFDMSNTRAAALTSCTVMGGALTNTLFALRQRHPLADRPLINWDIVLLMEPTSIIGAVLGSLVHQVMPQIAVVILLFTIVGFVDVRTTLKGYRQFKREGGLGQLCGPKRTEVVRRQTTAPGVDTEEGTEVAKDEEEGPDLPFPLAPKGDSALSFLVSDDGDYGQGSGSSSSRGRPASYAAAKEPGEEAEKDEDEEAAAARACSALLERERRTALWKPALLTLCFAGVLVLESVANKGLAGPRCFNGWWLTTMAVIPWALSFVVSVRRYLLWDTQVKVAVGFPFKHGDPVWTRHGTLLFPAVCVRAGLLAGIFGIGGGLVKGPILLEIGVLPPVAAMVAAVMVLYSASTSTFSYALFGQVTLDYALFFFLWAALWTFVGQVGLEFLPKRYRMASFIVLAVGVTILLSVSLYVGHAIDTIVADPRAAVAIPRFCPS